MPALIYITALLIIGIVVNSIACVTALLINGWL